MSEKPIDVTKSKMRPIGLLSIDVKTIYDLLARCSVGDVIAYATMQAAIGRSVTGTGRWILASARRRALHQNAMLFGSVSKVGVKRLSDPEIVDTGKDAVDRIHRITNKSARNMTAIRDFDALPTESKVRHNTYLSALALLGHISKEKQLKRLQEKVNKEQVALPLAKTLEAFRD
jgi:hypothetical protein